MGSDISHCQEIPTFDDDSTQEEIEAHQKHYDDANKVSCIMASSMSPELQKTFENTWAYKMKQQLKEMFQAKAGKERLDVVKSLICHTPPRRNHEMEGYFDRLESLNMVFDAELSINIILSGLPAYYNQFMLSSSVLTVSHNAKKRKTSYSNWKRKAAKGKSDRGSKRKVKSEIAPTSDPKEAVCFYCNIKMHWKRSCPKYLKDLKDEKWGFCNTKGHWKRSCPKYLKDLKDGKGLKESRRLKHEELNLVMGNRKITPMTRIRKYHS
ncbi:retrotransposon protein, putative, ty1-copia subclass [Tanacetum coccineum]|uniref:Retrotransposon protein, putative, ty1-copia subclass n=1 Tax=Tanacetum coccineum TaxID=301880 RepID=A0ABQ4WWT1_9ASTR